MDTQIVSSFMLFLKVTMSISVLFSLPIWMHRLGFHAVTTCSVALSCVATLPCQVLLWEPLLSQP